MAASFAVVLFLFAAFTTVTPESNDGVAILWGLPDTTAILGQLFRYKVPSDAFEGAVDSYQVKEATGTDTLPEWLFWDAETQEFFGVPTVDDLGPCYVQVKALGTPVNDTHVSMAIDVFTIHVMEEMRLSKAVSSAKQQERSKEIVCETQEPVEIIALTLKANMRAQTALQRKQLLENAAQVFDLPVSRFRLFTQDFWDAQRKDFILGGTGEEASIELNDGQLVLAWRVGCGSHVSRELSDTAKNVAAQLKEGSVGLKLGYPVMLWSASSVHFEPRRRKRQVGQITPTPVTGRTQPTVTGITAPRSSTSSSTSTTRKTTTQTQTARTRSTTQTSTTIPTSTTPKTTPPMPKTTPPKKTISMSPPMLTFTCVTGQLCTFSLMPINAPSPVTVKGPSGEGLNTYETYLANRNGDDVSRGTWYEYFGTASKNHTFSGLALDTLPEEGRTFSLRISNRNYEIVGHTDIKIDMKEAEMKNPSKRTHVFNAALEQKNELAQKWDQQAQLLTDLAQLFDSKSDATQLNLLMVNKTALQWVNNTLVRTSTCDWNHLKALNSTLNTLTREQRLQQKVKYITNANLEGVGPCAASNALIDTDAKKPISEAGIKKDDTFLTMVVPIVVIVVLLLLAFIVACVLYRKNQKTKKVDEGKVKDITRGKPVIIQGEVEGDEPGVTTPMLLKNERGPLPPHEATHRSAHQETPFTDSPLYTPPPPVQTTNGERGKRSTGSTQREPPPYLSP